MVDDKIHEVNLPSPITQTFYDLLYRIMDYSTIWYTTYHI